MSNLVIISVNNQTVYVETEKRYGSEDISAVDTTLNKTEDAFQRAKSIIINIASDLIGTIRQMDETLTPNEFEFQFSLKIGAEGNVVITKVSGEAQFVVTMKYIHNKHGDSQ